MSPQTASFEAAVGGGGVIERSTQNQTEVRYYRSMILFVY